MHRSLTSVSVDAHSISSRSGNIESGPPSRFSGCHGVPFHWVYDLESDVLKPCESAERHPEGTWSSLCRVLGRCSEVSYAYGFRVLAPIIEQREIWAVSDRCRSGQSSLVSL